jgi:hypothetical protein
VIEMRPSMIDLASARKRASGAANCRPVWTAERRLNRRPSQGERLPFEAKGDQRSLGSVETSPSSTPGARRRIA